MIRLLAILLLCFVSGCAGFSRNLDTAPEGVQSILMWHKPSGERIEVIYRRGGHYDAAAFAEIDHLFRDRHTGEEAAIDPALIDVIADLRDKMIMPTDTPIELTSGYRSPQSNAQLAKTNRHVAKNSYHTKGQAADIRIPDMNSRVLELVATTMQRGGVALYPDSGHVHVDVGPVRGWEVKRGREGTGDTEGPSAKKAKSAAQKKGAATVKPAVSSKTYAPSRSVVPLPPAPDTKAKKPAAASKAKSKVPASPSAKASVKKIKAPESKTGKKTAKKPAPKPAAKASGKKSKEKLKKE
jgi:uncharacterized protein YcbK (DUF882 family)